MLIWGQDFLNQSSFHKCWRENVTSLKFKRMSKLVICRIKLSRFPPIIQIVRSQSWCPILLHQKTTNRQANEENLQASFQNYSCLFHVSSVVFLFHNEQNFLKHHKHKCSPQILFHIHLKCPKSMPSITIFPERTFLSYPKLRHIRCKLV